jgi:rhamnose utilization protein RhaD (predicted bifunctional aldolase and dehydrogenase)/NAD(P)-dependent dehydrogenase (short-subunit alcohol dehydrogenase family)
MRSAWDDGDAEAMVARYGAWGRDVALRVYSSRLLGQDPALVLHGGGNTSVKAPWIDRLGQPIRALWVKGSGSDLAALEPKDLPPLRIKPLLRLREVREMSDEGMVQELRRNLLDPAAPNPSVETLLHAWLPGQFVDHSHAEALLRLGNRPDGVARLLDLFAGEVPLVPYVIPGFPLAHAALDALEARPGGNALWLRHHGLFTWGPDARSSYERHIELVDRAERALTQVTVSLPAAPVPSRDELTGRAAELAMALRGACGRRIVVWRATPDVLRALQVVGPHEAASGPLTPDHVIRTKAAPLLLRSSDPDYVRAQVVAYRTAYEDRFTLLSEGQPGLRVLDGYPPVVWAPGLGLFAVGDTRRDANIAADIAERTLIAKATTPGLMGLPEQDLFDVEYWSLEQAKLGKGSKPPLSGRVAVVTGAAGAIGTAICRRFVADGAIVLAVDRDTEGLMRLHAALGSSVLPVPADVTAEDEVEATFRYAAVAVGGVDLVVINAGVAVSRPIVELELETWRRVTGVNLDGAFLWLREAARHLRAQGAGGDVVLVSTKNVAAPGAEFAAYSASKAGAHQLARVAALELAKDDVRVNLVAPDGIFADGDVPSGLWAEVGPERAASRGLTMADLPEHYRQRNLLKTRITGADVAEAVVFLARRAIPVTGAVIPVDGGLPEAFLR